jgi:hypothetical protein
VGQPNPSLTGVITGALPADSITASYTTTATMSSAAGSYPIVPTVSANPKLSNYTVSTVNGTLTVTTAAGTGAQNFSTSFPATENPISQSGAWTDGSSAGGSLWGDVQTTPGQAFGASQPTTYGDATAILTGSWGATQSASATVLINATPSGGNKEVEVRLRTTISSNSISGYEVYCSVEPSQPYCHIARWNGPNGSWCNLESTTPSNFLANGDVLYATASGTNPVTLTGFINGVQIMQVNDDGVICPSGPGGPGGPWATGAPGIGFYNTTGTGWSDFGISSFTATAN